MIGGYPLESCRRRPHMFVSSEKLACTRRMHRAYRILRQLRPVQHTFVLRFRGSRKRRQRLKKNQEFSHG